MKGDFTRDTFDKRKHFSRVLKQQGRVELDADFNEATAIMLHRQQALAEDLIGQHGTPPNADGTVGGGFKIEMIDSSNFKIGIGHYYVDGILCENEERKDENGDPVDITYKTQPDFPEPPGLPPAPFVVYLDVWERHITTLEDEFIQEKALNGVDTAGRAKVVWQAKFADKLADGGPLPRDVTCEEVKKNWAQWLKKWQSGNRGLLKAMAGDINPSVLENPCITPPEAGYRGAENQLYRVEIHRSGNAGESPVNDITQGATFKWSRDNGSVVFPIELVGDNWVTVKYLGRDDRSTLQIGDWVEIVDDDYTLHNRADPLLQVESIDPDENRIKLKNAPAANVGRDPEKHPLLRRWHPELKGSTQPDLPVPASDGAFLVEENKWLTLESGVRIYFASAPQSSTGEPSDPHEYRTGDYWLIPARTATGNVEWPTQKNEADQTITENNKPVLELLPPRGVEHHFAPLAVIPVSNTVGGADDRYDCRRKVTSVLGPDTNLQVRNLAASGSLSVSGSTSLGGKVGIGSTTPRNPLAIKAQGVSEELISFEDLNGVTTWHINQNRGGSTPGLNFAETGVQDGRLFIEAGGNVGIGTTDPQAKLDVQGAIRFSSGVETDNEMSLTREKLFRSDHAGILKFSLSKRQMDGEPDPAYSFYIGHPNQSQVIGPDGEVEEVIDDFRAQMIVASNGAVFVRGLLTAQGFRLRSGVKGGFVTDHFVNNAGDTLEQGDVVVLGKQEVSHFWAAENMIPIPEVDLTDQAYEPRVCGIVFRVMTKNDLPFVEGEPEPELIRQLDSVPSEKKSSKKKPKKAQPPGHPLAMLVPDLGENSDRARVKQAQLGEMVTMGCFAHCKVDADIAAIQIGDLLTTSPTKGHAQKVMDRSQATGAIIGKALGSLKKGKGKIPVLVMLQ